MDDFISRVDGARRLEKYLYKDQGSLFEPVINAAFDCIGFTDDYVTACVSRGGLHKGKALKDSVWGMMEFDESAMRLIDSPLLQRLRRIKQLGFSYLTYPSAEHSRFPHSVGMAHVVDRFTAAIDRQRRGVEMDAQYLEGFKHFADLKPLRAEELVHAALLHDIGHLPFSHAAETAIESGSERFLFGGLSYEDFKYKSLHLLKGKISLSEALSIAIILSPRFRRYYERYVDKRAGEDKDSVLRIACLIAGLRVHDHCGNIQGLISSSSVDADKIDYVNRDAAACGIPVGVDVSRVFLGSSVVGIKPAKAKELGFGSEDRFVFALNASGWDTYDEVIRARSTLYQRVYLHSFTRTAEAIFSRALKVNAQIPGSQLKDALAIWSLADNAILDELVKSPDAEVSKLSASLRDRQMPKKACALGATVLVPLMAAQGIFPKIFDGPENVATLNTMTKQIADPSRRRFSRKHEQAIDSVKFENLVIDEAEGIREKLRERDYEGLPTGELTNVVLIDIAGLDDKKSDAPVFQHGELLSSGLLTNVRGVSDASDHFRQIGYVMAPGEWREIVSLATRMVVYRLSLDDDLSKFAVGRHDDADETALELPLKPLAILGIDAIHRRTGLSRSNLKRLMQELEETDYFDNEPFLASKTTQAMLGKPLPGVEKFAGEHGWSVSAETICGFIDQFPPRLRPSLIEVLDQGAFVDRDTAASLIAKEIKKIRSPKSTVVVVPLSASSGANLISTLRQKLKHDSVQFAASLREVAMMADPNLLVLFVDDNCASGTQAAAQFWAYSGKPRQEWPSDLTAENGLAEVPTLEESKALSEMRIKIVVAYGHPNANSKLALVATKLGMQHFEGVVYAKQIAASLNWDSDLKGYLFDVGKELLSQDRWNCSFDDLDDDRKAICSDNAFGYGNLGGLTVFQNTVPTSTVNAFWMPGMISGRPWIPLALRQGRMAKVVLG